MVIWDAFSCTSAVSAKLSYFLLLSMVLFNSIEKPTKKLCRQTCSSIFSFKRYFQSFLSIQCLVQNNDASLQTHHTQNTVFKILQKYYSRFFLKVKCSRWEWDYTSILSYFVLQHQFSVMGRKKLYKTLLFDVDDAFTVQFPPDVQTIARF